MIKAATPRELKTTQCLDEPVSESPSCPSGSNYLPNLNDAFVMIINKLLLKVSMCDIPEGLKARGADSGDRTSQGVAQDSKWWGSGRRGWAGNFVGSGPSRDGKERVQYLPLPTKAK